MTHEFVITPMQIWQLILLLCGAIISIGGAIKIVKGWLHDAKKPTSSMKESITQIEEKMEDYDTFFKNDKLAIDELRAGQQIMYKSHLALIGHAIDGNNTEQLQAVKGELQQFLINRK